MFLLNVDSKYESCINGFREKRHWQLGCPWYYAGAIVVDWGAFETYPDLRAMRGGTAYKYDEDAGGLVLDEDIIGLFTA